MARQTTSESRQAGADVSAQIASMMTANGAAMASFTQAFQTYLNGMTRFSGELTDFVNTRMRHDMELGQDLAGCRDWTEAASLQQQWFSEATGEYLAETQKLMGLTAKMATEGLTPVYEQTGKVLHQVTPKKA